MLDHALKYADNGWHVLPLHGIVNGQCTCGLNCKSPGKHPITKNGLKDASVDPDQITAWWTDHPSANIGLATGSQSNLWIIDVDNKHSVEVGNILVGQGDLSIREIENEHGPIPEGRYVDTGGGGRHYYFAFSDGCGGNRTGIRDGIDVRGEGGYVVAPPSVHVSGHVYQWGNQDVLPGAAPGWLVALAHQERNPGEDFGPDDLIVEGSRNAYLHALGARYRREQGFTDWQLFGLLMAHNHHQCSPPLTSDEVRQIARNCAKYEYTPPVDLSAWNGDVPPIPEGGDLAMSIEYLLANPPPQPVPLIHGVIDCGTGVLFGGQPNVGKSWMVMDLAVAVSTGRPWLDSFATDRGGVLMIDEEGTEYGQYERFQMLFDGRGLAPFDVPLHVAIGTGIRLDTDIGITRVRRMLERYKPRIVVLDSLVRLHSGDENSAKSMSNFFEITKKLMRTYETTFCFTHHVRKPSIELSDPGDLLRGTSEIRAWPDTIFVAAPGETNQEIIIHHVKARYGKRMAPFRVIMQIDDNEKTARIVHGGDVEDDGPITQQNKILRTISDLTEQGQFATIEVIADTIKRTTRTTRDYLKRLQAARMIDSFELKAEGRPILAYRITGA